MNVTARRIRTAITCAACLMSSLAESVSAPSAEFGTIEEARVMLDRAIEEVKANKWEAITKFNHNYRQFRDRDLYVFCFNGNDGRFTAHEAMIGADVRSFVDMSGKPFGEEMFKVAKEDQIVEVAFTSPYPGSTIRVPKRSYVTRIGDQVCGVSVYPGLGGPTE